MSSWIVKCFAKVWTLFAKWFVQNALFLHVPFQVLERYLHNIYYFYIFLYRCSRDIDYMDSNIPMMVGMWLFAVNPLLATIFIISYTTPIFLVLVIPTGIVYLFTQVSYFALIFWSLSFFSPKYDKNKWLKGIKEIWRNK